MSSVYSWHKVDVFMKCVARSFSYHQYFYAKPKCQIQTLPEKMDSPLERVDMDDFTFVYRMPNKFISVGCVTKTTNTFRI